MKAWVAGWDIRNAGSDVSLHTAQSGAIASATEGLGAAEASIASAALQAQGYWQDREDDPRVCLYVREAEVQS
jgi:hypothetical protein